MSDEVINFFIKQNKFSIFVLNINSIFIIKDYALLHNTIYLFPVFNPFVVSATLLSSCQNQSQSNALFKVC